MATIPGKIEKFVTAEKDEFSSIAQANWQKAAGMMEYLNRSYPVGMLMFLDVYDKTLPENPDPKYWQLCDGTQINNTDSPFHGTIVPNLGDRFIKHPKATDATTSVDGSPWRFLGHFHFYYTSWGNDAGSFNVDASNAVTSPIGWHYHVINGSSNPMVEFQPLYRYMKVYLRIV